MSDYLIAGTAAPPSGLPRTQYVALPYESVCHRIE